MVPKKAAITSNTTNICPIPLNPSSGIEGEEQTSKALGRPIAGAPTQQAPPVRGTTPLFPMPKGKAGQRSGQVGTGLSREGRELVRYGEALEDYQ